MRSLLLILAAAATVLSCGDAGVQVRVGDDYPNEIQVSNFGSEMSFSGFVTTDVNNDLLDFGAIISELTVERVEVSVQNFDGSITGDLDVSTFGSPLFSETGITLENGTIATFTNAAGLNSLAANLQSSDITLEVDASSMSMLGDDDFQVIITIIVDAIVVEED